jgi:hypothetical protein
MPALDMIAHQLSHLRFESLESHRDVHTQIEKTMIDAPQAHP